MEYGGFKMEVWRSMVKRIIILLFVFSSAYGQANRFAGFGSRTCNCDANARRYLDSTGVTDTAKVAGICNFFKQLKDSSLWGKAKAIYVAIDTTAERCKWNLMSPTDADTSFRLTFMGGWIFNSGGMWANGINAVANAHLIPLSVFSIRDYAVCAYINGGTLLGGAAPLTVFTQSTDGNFNVSDNGIVIRPTIKAFVPNGDAQPFVVSSNSSITGVFLGSVLTTGVSNLYKDGVIIGSTTTSGGALSDRPFYLAGLSLNPVYFQNVKLGVVAITVGLTKAESQTLTNLITILKNRIGL